MRTPASERERQRARRATPEGRALHQKNTHRHRLKQLGLTPEQYDTLLANQKYRCTICRTDTPGGRGRFHVDHDHTCCPGTTACGKCVRGLLCHHCNLGLGNFRDDPTRLTLAAEYLS
jgi:hypothetical protein